MAPSASNPGSKPEVPPLEPVDAQSAMDRVRAIVFSLAKEEDQATASTPEKGWGVRLVSAMELLEASAQPVGRSVFRFTVKPEHCNGLNNLHGGCTATIFDWLTTSALGPIARPGYWLYAGVSRTLNVTYLRPVPVGTTVIIDSTVVHAGKRLCTLASTMKRESDGALLAICEHGKVSIDPEVTKI
ncbi:hypothetical protein HYALB_00008597 [Hymenoscyphus albidus]|uniref:Thioesterase domain-containing protein n=1 Tax=Hymenoscyphus albidus TaxID=595503 RepID=A0A9N9L9P0_9HELO|nr:hypothetical protein HYALB_00008597 [Hymenoscyphus albidus]